MLDNVNTQPVSNGPFESILKECSHEKSNCELVQMNAFIEKRHNENIWVKHSIWVKFEFEKKYNNRWMIQNAVKIALNAIEDCLNVSANSTQAQVYWVMCALLHGDSSDASESKHANRNGRRASTWLYSLCVKWMNSLLDHCFTVERCWHYYICSKYICTYERYVRRVWNHV